MVLCICVFLAGCLSGNILPVADDVTVENEQVKLFVVTTREKDEDNVKHFSGERSRSVSYSEFDISIPTNRDTGSLAYPKRLKPKAEHEFAAASAPKTLEQRQFIDSVNRELSSRNDDDKIIFLGLHGFNNTFTEGVLRSAQLVHDYKLGGVPVHFSWPSQGKVQLYLYDLDSAVYSTNALADTIKLLDQTQAKSIVIYAHSMGAFLAMEALVQLKREGYNKLKDRISAIVIASPDVDGNIFELQLKSLGKDRPGPFLMFVNRKDIALKVSNLLRGSRARIGQISNQEIATYKKEGLAIIDLSSVSDAKDNLHHSVFASSPRIIDLFTDPQKRKNDPLLKNISCTDRLQLGLFVKTIKSDADIDINPCLPNPTDAVTLKN